MSDPYVYPNGVLINKLNIQEKEKLDNAEADIGFSKLINIDSLIVNNDHKFDENLIKDIHKHIFEDIFDWAGEYRTVQIVKEERVLPGYSIPYSNHKNIDKELKEKLADLNSIIWQNLDVDTIATTFARKIALIWKIHPFRDGNTRTILSFSYLYAKEHSFEFDMKTFTNNLTKNKENTNTTSNIRDKFVLACLDEKDYPEVEYLANVFKSAILNFNNQQYMENKKSL